MAGIGIHVEPVCIGIQLASLLCILQTLRGEQRDRIFGPVRVPLSNPRGRDRRTTYLSILWISPSNPIFSCPFSSFKMNSNMATASVAEDTLNHVMSISRTASRIVGSAVLEESR